MKKLLAILSIMALLLLPALPGYADEADPRDPNTKAVHVAANGKVDGVELVYIAHPEKSYQLVQARLIDEASAGGNTVAKFVIVDCAGTPISENVYLAWPWPSLKDGHQLPGNQNNEHYIGNGYTPPDYGPLAIYVGDSAGNINSDVIGGLGLPWKRHVSFYLAFRQRCGVSITTPTVVVATATPKATATPGPGLTPGPTATPAVSADLGGTNDLLRQILSTLQTLARHLGVEG